MSAEDILILQARSSMFTNKVNQLIQDEVIKGCSPGLYPQPVALEPCYEAIPSIQQRQTRDVSSDCVFESPSNRKEIHRFQVWLSPQQMFDWNNNELFLKQLYSVTHRIGFEIIGNEKQLLILLQCHNEDKEIIHSAFQGQFESCELTSFELDAFAISFDLRLSCLP